MSIRTNNFFLYAFVGFGTKTDTKRMRESGERETEKGENESIQLEFNIYGSIPWTGSFNQLMVGHHEFIENIVEMKYVDGR